MALNDDAVLTAAVGYIYVGAVGTAPPTPAALDGLNLSNPSGWAATGWDTTGHTSVNDLPEFGLDGGDTEVRGSWQKKKLREVTTSDPIDFLTMFLQQWDEANLALYYGPNASDTPGVFGVAAAAGDPNEAAVLVVIVDGDFRIGFHAHKASVKRDDAIQLATDDFASLPIKATFLQHETELLFSWINEALFNAVVSLPVLNLHSATAGTFTLKVDGVATSAITVAGLSAGAIKTAVVAVDDGIDAADVTVTASGSNYEIDIPAVLTLGTDSSTGGTGITLS